MKANNFFLICLTVLFCLLSACGQPSNDASSADDAGLREGEYEYEIDENGGVRITSHKDWDAFSIIVPEQIAGRPVTALDNCCFEGHPRTVSITLPSSLTTISDAPFYKCFALKEIFIPDNVCNIENNMYNPFFRCTSLANITVDPENEFYTDVDGVLYDKDVTVLISCPEGKTDVSYVVPETVKKINGDAFGYRTKLKEITILSNVTEFPESDSDHNLFIFPDDITLIVESGSVAEQYAIQCELKYKVLS